MHNDLHVVEHDPLTGRESIDRNCPDTMCVAQPLFDLSGNRFQVRLRSAGADYEKVGEAGDALQIENDDLFRFFVSREVRARLG